MYDVCTFARQLLPLHFVPSPSSRPVLGNKDACVSFEIVAANAVEPFRHLVVGFESLELEGLDGETAIPITQ